MRSDENGAEDVWQALSGLTPSLRAHIKVYPQTFRGERWYVLLDEISGSHLRINSSAYNVMGRFDGNITLGSIFEVLHKDANPDDRPERDEIVRLVSQLFHLNALNGIKDKTTAQLVSDYSERESGKRFKKLISPLVIRIPMFDPDRLLEKISPEANWFFTGWALFIWLVVFLIGLTTTLLYLPDIQSELSGEIMKPRNLVLLWLLYPFIKLVHEFAHAICVKRWGGEVHEMGVTLLVLTPVPYVNASAASAFKSKWKRALVSGAGILVELFIASLAILLWSLSEPGLFHDCMLGLFLIGAVSTVVFNANPLLKFDGYFVLQDLIEIPNLYSRSAAWYRYVFKRYVLKLDDAVSPQTAHGEKRWFAFYGFASTAYRLVVIVSIVGFLLGKYLIVGALLAVWALVQQALLPIIRFVRYLHTAPELGSKRGTVWKTAGVGLVVFALVVFLLPLPQSTMASGIVWVPEQGQIYAASSGFVDRVHRSHGEKVNAGDLIAEMSDPELELQLKIETSKLRAIGIEQRMTLLTDAAAFARLEEDHARQNELVLHLEERTSQLKLNAQTTGILTLPDGLSLSGRYYKQGDLVAHIVDPDRYIVQAVVPESESALIHQSVQKATVRLAEHSRQRIAARVSREIPAPNRQLPSAALGVLGGGGIAVASSDKKGLTTVGKVFHLQLEFEEPLSVAGVGERAYVKLHHRYEPLANRWFRSISQVFLENIPMWLG